MSHSKHPPGIHDEQFAALARHKNPQALMMAPYQYLRTGSKFREERNKL